MSILPLLFLVIVFSACTHDPVPASARSSCGRVDSSYRWRYCITRPLEPKSNTVIYYFHGGGSNEYEWVHSNNDSIREIWAAQEQPEPTVINISMGPIWHFSDNVPSGKKISSIHDFTENVLPELEKNLKFKPESRIAMGNSMGGFNASALGLRHPELFAKAALVCPAVLRENFYSEKAFKEYIHSSGALKRNAEIVNFLVHREFVSDKQYRAMSPQAQLKSYRSDHRIKLFVTCGKEDGFGFFVESENFVKLARDKNLDVIWKPVPGNHCSRDIPALAAFLISSPAPEPATRPPSAPR